METVIEPLLWPCYQMLLYNSRLTCFVVASSAACSAFIMMLRNACSLGILLISLLEGGCLEFLLIKAYHKNALPTDSLKI